MELKYSVINKFFAILDFVKIYLPTLIILQSIRTFFSRQIVKNLGFNFQTSSIKI